MTAQEEAKELGHSYVGTEHLLLAILKVDKGPAVEVLEEMGASYSKVRSEIISMVGMGMRGFVPSPQMTPRAKRVTELAYEEAKILGSDKINPEHILLGILREGEGIAIHILRKLGVDLNTLRREIIDLYSYSSNRKLEYEEEEEYTYRTVKQLEGFGVNLTELAAKKELDPVIGREEEIERVMQVLVRRKKNNPVLIGDPGVGKTAIVEGLAQRIVAGDVPEILKNKVIFSLDVAALVAGTKYRGEFEKRMKKLLQIVTKDKNIILFIDEIHTIVGAGSAEGAIDAANILKLVKKISEVKEILEKDVKVKEIMKKEFKYLKERYGDPRRTKITDEELRYDMEELIAEEDIVITLSHKGYLKSTPLSSYRSQRRGGKGITVSKLSEDDEVEFVVVTKNISSTLFITNLGKAYVLKNYQIETTGRNTRGRHISAFLNLEETEKVVALAPLNGKGKDLVIVTKHGKIKRTALEEFENATSNRGVRAIRIEAGDEIISARVIDSERGSLVVATKLGMVIRFPVSDVRRMGRNAAGVQAIKLQPDDEVVSMDVVPSENEGEILTVTEKGFGKRTPVELYRIQKRGGTGLRNISDVKKTGYVVAVRYVRGDEEIVVVTKNGMMIRIPVSDIGIIGRITKGVKLIELGDDSISKVAVVK
nr:ATP-dependent Clp protease, ATPase subunit [Thermotoga sp. KOL6]